MKYVVDSHTHSVASGHAYNTIMEMARFAAEKGLKLLALTEHSMTLPGACHEYYFRNLKVLPRQMEGIEVLFGTEVNIIDSKGNMDMSQDLLQKMDVVVASLHQPCYEGGTREENTQAFLNAMKNPAVNIIGHCDDGRYPVDYEALALGAKENHVLLELNNSSLRKGCSRVNTRENDIQMLTYCKKHEVPIILDTDAHCGWDVGNFDLAEELLKEMDFPEELIVNRSLERYKSYVNRFKNQ